MNFSKWLCMFLALIITITCAIAVMANGSSDAGFEPLVLTYIGNSAEVKVSGQPTTFPMVYSLMIASYETKDNVQVLDSVNIKQFIPKPGVYGTWNVNLDSFGDNTKILKAFLWESNMKPVDEKTLFISSNEPPENLGESIMADLKNHSGKGNHPRLMLTDEDFQRITTTDDTHYKTAISNVRQACTNLIKKDSSGNYITAAYTYDIADGIRLLPVSRGVLSRVFNLSMAYRLTKNEVYAERAYAELESAANFPDWNPKHFLDVGEMCNAFAIGYDWLYDWMNDSQKTLIRNAIITHGLNPVMDDYLDRPRTRTYKWYQDTPGDNWKFVCNGGVSNAVLAICDEPGVDQELCADVLDYAFNDIYTAIRNLFLEDGSYAEGFTYWSYSSVYLGYYISSLVSATGTDYGLSMYEPLKESAYYVKSISSNDFTSFNFGDAEEVNLANEIFLWYGKIFNAPELSGVRTSVFSRTASTTDLLWYHHGKYSSPKIGKLTYGHLGGTEAAFRSGWETSDLYGAIHFGKNNVYHAHSDTGTFVIEYGGKRFFNDLGQDNYNVSDYTKAYRYRTEGHNTISLRYRMNGLWNNQASKSECFIDSINDESGKNNFVISDMSDAYDGKGVVRGMMMTADKKAIIVQDRLTPSSWYEGYWFAHTKASVTLSGDKRGALLTIDGVKMWAQILSSGHTFSLMDAKHLTSSTAPKDQYDNSAYKKLAIKFTGDNEISVAFIPLSSNESSPSSLPSFTTISNWQ